jgi:hypothetical protein
VFQIRRFHARDDVGRKFRHRRRRKEEISESEEENGVVNNTQEPEENLPVAVSEAVGEENEPEFQPREAEKTKTSKQTRPPRWHNDYARY